MSTENDTVQVGKVVSAPPTMPSEDVQDLLIRRVMDESVSRMQKKITAVLTITALAASVLGVQGYLQIQELNAKLVTAGEHANDLEERLHTFDAEVNAAKRLQEEILKANQVQQTAYQHLLDRYQETAAGATRDAFAAAAQASLATASAGAAASEARERLVAVEDLNKRVNTAEKNVGTASTELQRLVQRLNNTMFSVWTVVLDEKHEYREIGDSGFEGRVASVHRGEWVELEIIDRAHSKLCGRDIQLRIGRSVECRYGGALYRVTLVWALKQGGIGSQYRDRAQVQLARIEGSDAPDQEGSDPVTQASSSGHTVSRQ